MEESITSIEERIKNVIVSRLRLQVNVKELSSNTSLLGKGLGLDSITLQELVVGLEGEFNILIDESELRIEIFEDIGSLANYVSNKLNNT